MQSQLFSWPEPNTVIKVTKPERKIKVSLVLDDGSIEKLKCLDVENEQIVNFYTKLF